MFGAAMNSQVSEKPRRLLFLLLDFFTIVGLVITLWGTFATLLIGRFIVGITIGLNTAVIPTYINEIAPIQISGLLGSCF